MKQVQLKKDIYHYRGAILAGSFYDWDGKEDAYVLRNETGEIISTINDAFVKAMPEMFQYVVDPALN